MRQAAVAVLSIFLFAPLGYTYTPQKDDVSIVKIGDLPAQHLSPTVQLATADTCIVYEGGEISWRIDGWVFGNELYKSLLDPAASCAEGYPFEVWEIHLIMAFDLPTPLNVSVDIEDIDNTNPGCPVPGVLLAISAEYQNQVPDSGLYDIGIPLDSPIVVNGPFFAGFFISNAIEQSIGAAVTTDTVPVPCTSYNIWDDEIGFVDLTNNQFYNFPGRLVMFAVGIPVEPVSCCTTRGNVNGSVNGIIDISDLTYLVKYMFKSGPPPPCLEAANVNGSSNGIIDISDLTFLVTYMFRSGTTPPACP